MEEIIVFCLQALYMLLRVINLKQIYSEKALYASLSNMVITGIGLFCAYLGIMKGFEEGNIRMVLSYVVGSGLGTYLGVKFKL